MRTFSFLLPWFAILSLPPLFLTPSPSPSCPSSVLLFLARGAGPQFAVGFSWYRTSLTRLIAVPTSLCGVKSMVCVRGVEVRVAAGEPALILEAVMGARVAMKCRKMSWMNEMGA